MSIIIFPFAWAFTFLKGFLIITQKFLVVGLICAAYVLLFRGKLLFIRFRLSILPFFLIATHLGGICLAFAALLYLLAWTNREKPIPRSELEKGTFRWIWWHYFCCAWSVVCKASAYRPFECELFYVVLQRHRSCYYILAIAQTTWLW